MRHKFFGDPLEGEKKDEEPHSFFKITFRPLFSADNEMNLGEPSKFLSGSDKI